MEYKLMYYERDRDVLRNFSRAKQLFLTSSFRQQGQFYTFVNSLGVLQNIAFRFTLYAMYNLHLKNERIFLQKIYEEVQISKDDFYKKLEFVVHNSKNITEDYRLKYIKFIKDNEQRIKNMDLTIYCAVLPKFLLGRFFLMYSNEVKSKGWSIKFYNKTKDGKELFFYLSQGYLF